MVTIRRRKKTRTPNISYSALTGVLAFLLIIQNIAVYLNALAAEGDITEYTPQTVRSIDRKVSAPVQWHSLVESLTYDLSFEAGIEEFSSENASYLAITKTPSIDDELSEGDGEEISEENDQEENNSSQGGQGSFEDNEIEQEHEDPIVVEDESSLDSENGEQDNLLPNDEDELADDADPVDDAHSEEEEEDEEVIEGEGEDEATEEGQSVDNNNADEDNEEDALGAEDENSDIEENHKDVPDGDGEGSVSGSEETEDEALEEGAEEDAEDVVDMPEEESAEDISLGDVSSTETVALFDIFNQAHSSVLLASLTPSGETPREISVETENNLSTEEETVVLSPYVEYSQFRGHPENKDERFKDATLKVSLAGKSLKGGSLRIEHSLDGEDWIYTGAIDFTKSHANKTRGDFYHITLQGVDTISEVQTVKVRFSYVIPEGTVETLSEDPLLFIDGVSIETTSTGQILSEEEMLLQEQILSEEENLTPEEKKLRRLNYANKIFELLFQGTITEPLQIYHQKFTEGVPPLELSLKGASTTAQAELVDNFVVYKDVYSATDFYYIPTEHGLKEEILLKDPSHPSTFTYVLNLDQFDYVQTEPNKIDVYKKGKAGEILFKLYSITAPYMEDASGARSENLVFEIEGDELTLVPDQIFLEEALYPVIVDPTVELSVLTVYSHPLTGETWSVDFATIGTADLYITPRNQVTIDEITFESLFCGDEEREPEILDDEVIYYPNWNCDDEVATVHHITDQEGSHVLDFEFGGETDTAFNGTVTWDGGGGDNNWSTCENWTGDVCPAPADDVVFDGTSTKDATLDTATTVRRININSGYTGTVTQSDSADLTVTNFFSQATGTFVGGQATTTYNHNFTISGGTYTAASTTYFDNSSVSARTININSTQTFEDVIFDAGFNFLDWSISSGDTLTVNDLRFEDRVEVQGGTINVLGDISVNTIDGTVGGNTVVDLGSASVQTITFQNHGSAMSQLRLDSADDASDVVDVNGNSDIEFGGFITTSDFSGTFSLTNATSGTSVYVTGGVGEFTLSGGTVTGGSETWHIVSDPFTINSGATFNAPSTTRFYANVGTSHNIDVNSTQTFEDVIFESNSGVRWWAIASGDTLTVDELTFEDFGGEVSGGTINVLGDISVNTVSGTEGGSATVDLGSASVQTITFQNHGAAMPQLRLDSADDASDIVDVNGNANIIMGGLITTSDFSGTFSLANATSGTLAYMTGGQGEFTLSGGTVTGGPETWQILNDNFTVNSGATFNAPSTTHFNNTAVVSLTVDVDSSLTFEDLIFDSSASSRNWVIASGDTLVVTGTTTIQNAADVLTGTIEARGDVVHSSTGTDNTAALLFTGTAASGKATQLFDLTGGVSTFDADITINKTEGEVKLLSELDMNATNQDLTIQEGTLYINGNALSVDGTSGTFTVEDGGIFKLQGGETVTANATYPSFASGSTLLYVGDEDGGADTLTAHNFGTTQHVTINTTDSGDTINADDVPFDINGNFTLTSGTFTAPSTTMTVAGNWVQTAGTLTPNGGTVSFDGTSQQITGDTTFYNFTKAVSSADTFTFGADDRQTVTNAWTVTGTSGNVLTLQSSSGGTQWEIDPQGTRTVEYVTVSDSNNVNATEMSISEAIVTNGGNNTNWGFNNNPAVSSLGPASLVDGSWTADTTPTLSFTLTDSDGDNMQYHIVVDDSSDFSSPVVDYTSATQAGGATSFTVGQAAGSGSYTTGSGGQTLSTATSYYWRVSATDENGGGGATTTANSGGIAFRVDTTDPTAGTASTGSVTETEITVSIVGASDAHSGLATNPYNFRNETEEEYSGATSSTSYTFSGLVPDTEYIFSVGVTDDVGNIATTSTTSARTLAQKPNALSTTIDSSTEITFTWSKRSNPPTVSYYPVNVTSSTTPGYISNNSYQFTGLTCETTYTFTVKAKNSDDVETTTATTTGTTSSCDSGGEGGGEEGSSETGGGSGGSSGGSSGDGGGTPTVSGTAIPVSPVDTTVEVFTINNESYRTTLGNAIVSENRALYLTFNPTSNITGVQISNSPDFQNATTYPPNIAVQWNICQASDGTLLPESQCARNKEYNVYIRFIDNFGRVTQTIEQIVYLYDPILPDDFFDFPEQNITDQVFEQNIITVQTESPFTSPFGETTGLQEFSREGAVENTQSPFVRNVTETGSGPFESAYQKFIEAWRDSITRTKEVIGTYTQYRVVLDSPLPYIQDNITRNLFVDGLITGYNRVVGGFTKTTLTAFEWLFGGEENRLADGPDDGDTNTGGNTDDGGTGGTGDDTGTGGGTETPVDEGNQLTNDVVRTAVTDVTSGLGLTNKDVDRGAKIAAIVGPATLALQQAFSLALFAGTAFAWLDLLLILLRHLHNILSFLHVRRERRTWGIVYDAKTKMPLEPVLVELIDVHTGRVVDRSVTDMAGQFGFLPRVGRFTIRAQKSHYGFPSKDITTKTDGIYRHVYRGEEFDLKQGHNLIAPNIPMDRLAPDTAQEAKSLYMKLGIIQREWGGKLSAALFWAGFMFVLANLFISFTALNAVLLIFYTGLVIYRYAKLNSRLWGQIEGMPELVGGEHMTLTVFHRRNPEQILAQTVVQKNGKFFLKVIEPGTYVLQVIKQGPRGGKDIVLTEDIAVGRDLVINHDIYLA